MRYFVTGATGFIGGGAARALRQQGHEVIAIVRNPAAATGLAELGVEVYPGDITDRETLRAPMAGADGVYHIAAWYKIGVKDPRAEAINVGGTRNVLEMMRELEIPKGVYTSTLAVYSDTGGRLVEERYRYDGPHLSEYDRTKWLAHYEVADPLIAAGLPLVIVQPGLVYGPGDSGPLHDAWAQYLRRRLPLAPKGTAYSWGYIDDIVQGHLLAMEKGAPGENYHLCGPPHTLIEALKMAEGITGVPAPRVRVPPGLTKALASIAGVVERAVPLPPRYSGEYLRVNAGVTYLGDNGRAKRELGFDPRPLADGLPETLAWEMAQLGMTR